MVSFVREKYIPVNLVVYENIIIKTVGLRFLLYDRKFWRKMFQYQFVALNSNTLGKQAIRLAYKVHVQFYKDLIKKITFSKLLAWS